MQKSSTWEQSNVAEGCNQAIKKDKMTADFADTRG